MTQSTGVTAQTIEALASASNIAFDAHQIKTLAEQVDQVLDYAHRVCSSPVPTCNMLQKNINVVRADMIVVCNTQELLDRAPHTEGAYFVVPLILENR
jgi:aspartyl/glutamyl-tRNA(Asn/Gln) amidotransferase C subunit